MWIFAPIACEYRQLSRKFEKLEKLDLHMWIFAPIARKYRQLSRKFEKVEFQRQSEFYKLHMPISINSVQNLFNSSSYLHDIIRQTTWPYKLNTTMHFKDINVFITPTPKILAWSAPAF